MNQHAFEQVNYYIFLHQTFLPGKILPEATLGLRLIATAITGSKLTGKGDWGVSTVPPMYILLPVPALPQWFPSGSHLCVLESTTKYNALQGNFFQNFPLFPPQGKPASPSLIFNFIQLGKPRLGHLYRISYLATAIGQLQWVRKRAGLQLKTHCLLYRSTVNYQFKSPFFKKKNCTKSTYFFTSLYC